MFGIASGPLRDHSVGTAGNALATGAAPSCVAITAGDCPMATRDATASTPQLVWRT
jgi:hypothetical protein